MKGLAVLVLTVLMIGCDVDNNNHGYGYDYDRITPLGIEYRNDGYAENGLTDYYLDKQFLKIYNCIQTQGAFDTPADPADVKFSIDLMVISVHQIENSNREARHYHDPSLIVILDRDSPYHITATKIALSHEYVHYILLQLTGWSSPEHVSAYFKLCY